MPYPQYPTGTSFGTLNASVAEPIAQGATTTIRVRNTLPYHITLVALQATATAISNGGANVDLQNNAAASHLGAVLALTAGATAVTTTFTGAAGTFIATNTDVNFVFNNLGGAGNLTDGQATLAYRVTFATTSA